MIFFVYEDSNEFTELKIFYNQKRLGYVVPVLYIITGKILYATNTLPGSFIELYIYLVVMLSSVFLTAAITIFLATIDHYVLTVDATALDDYVWKADENYGWKELDYVIQGKVVGRGYTGRDFIFLCILN